MTTAAVARHGQPGGRAREASQVLATVRTRTDERTHRLAQLEGALHAMLLVHGTLMTTLGAFLLVPGRRTTGGAFTALEHIPGWPWTWGAGAAWLGICLVMLRQLGQLQLCRLVLHGMTVWSIAYGFGLAAGAIQAGTAWYPPLIYAALAALYQIHAAVLTTPGLR